MKKWALFLLLTILFSFYYLSLAFVLIESGYTNLEQLFISDKLQLLLQTDQSNLEIFFFTFPVIPQILALPLSFYNTISAPILTSVILASCLMSYIVVKLFRLNFIFLAILIALYFLISPTIIYITTSGNGLYVKFITLFLIFHFLFKYIREFTIYNLVIVSVSFSILVFTDDNFLWLIIFIIPLIFFLSIINALGINKSIVGAYSQVIQNRSQKRKLFGRFFSLLLVLFFTPVTSFILFLLINKWYTGSFFYYQDAAGFSWNSANILALKLFNTNVNHVNFSFSKLYALRQSFLLSPLLIVMFFLGRRRFLFQYIIISILLLLVLLFGYLVGDLFSLNYLIIIHAVSLAVILHLLQTSLGKIYKANSWYVLVVISLFSISLLGEVYYFQLTNNFSEQKFYTHVVKQNNDKNMKSFKELAGFIQNNVEPNATILASNVIFYPSMAYTRSHVDYIDEFSPMFYSAIQKPDAYVNYVLTTKKASVFYKDNKLRQSLFNDKISHHKLYKVYTNNDFVLFKIKTQVK